jgi:Txe/YoeB family toxin of Txe-Axe toxin-antitoxin module
LVFEPRAFEDLKWWMAQDRKKAGRIADLIIETGRAPFVIMASYLAE